MKKGELMKKEKLKNNTEGITLIALVVTIIVLIILAGVSISLIFNSEGLFSKVNSATTKWNNAKNDEAEYLSSIANEIGNTMIYTGKYEEQVSTDIQKETKKYKVADGEWYIPKGFQESEETKEKTIKEGKVIKDKSGNEWVWIPCYLEDNGKKVGQEMYKEATEYKRTDFQQQYGSYSQYSETLDGTDAESIKKYGGFYIGRYEAGTDNDVTEEDNTRPIYIQKNKVPYRYISIANCLIKSINLVNYYNYDTNKVYTRLISSYSWDTAICFIQKTVNDYATNSPQGNYQDHKFSTEKGMINTGLTNPVCNIYDMGGNLYELSSEACSEVGFPHSARGGHFNYLASKLSAGNRGCEPGTPKEQDTFRPTLYLK